MSLKCYSISNALGNVPEEIKVGLASWWTACLARTEKAVDPMSSVHHMSLVWWCLPTISALRRQKLEAQEFEAILSYIADSRPAWDK